MLNNAGRRNLRGFRLGVVRSVGLTHRLLSLPDYYRLGLRLLRLRNAFFVLRVVNFLFFLFYAALFLRVLAARRLLLYLRRPHLANTWSSRWHHYLLLLMVA